MAGVHDVVSEFIEIINSNITDPNSTRLGAGKSWVFDDIPLSSLGSSNYPRIAVVSMSSTVSPHELNSNNQRVNARVEVQIRVKRTKWNDQTPQQFLDDLTLSVIEALRLDSSRTQLCDEVGVFQSVLEAENTTYLDDVIIKQLIYKNIMRR
jgi:hypothetical protein